MNPADNPELTYYREIEDLFAALRGIPHTLSSKDFQLLRSWWADEVPLSAVRTGITEVFARRTERGENEPVVSLSYCRHAVRAHAKRIAEMQVGSFRETSVDAAAVSRSVRLLADRLHRSSLALEADQPRVAAVIDRVRQAALAAIDLDPLLVEEHLFDLEATLLTGCLDELDEPARNEIEERAGDEADRVAANPEARERAQRALRDRLLRERLHLPRLEIEV